MVISVNYVERSVQVSKGLNSIEYAVEQYRGAITVEELHEFMENINSIMTDKTLNEVNDVLKRLRDSINDPKKIKYFNTDPYSFINNFIEWEKKRYE